MFKSQISKFLFITYLWSWILWVPLTLPYFNVFEMTELIEGLIMPAVMIGACGPLAAAVVLSYQNGKLKEVKAYFKRCLSIKVHYKFYILAVVLGFSTTVVAHYFTEIINLSDLPDTFFPSDLGIPFIVVVILYTLLLFLLGGGQEEFGWRGYLQDLTQDKYGIILGSIFVGVFWGLWHLPLWFIEGEGHAYYSFIAFMFLTISWSVTIGIVYNRSGKKMIIPWIMHTIQNLSVPLFPVLFMEDVPQPGYTVWVMTNIVLALVVTLWYIGKTKSEVTI